MELIGIQLDTAWEDRETSLGRARAHLDSTRITAGSLLVFPEMMAGGFSMDPARAADGAARQTETFLADTARRFSSCVLGGIARLVDGGTAANEAVAFGADGRELVRYRKMHPFTPAGEAEAYPAGDRVEIFSFGGFRIAPFICYDLRFPEIFREASDRGAELFCVIGNWPDRRHQHWSTLLRARAIENQAAVIGVNRAGADPHFSYAGGSAVLGPQGETLGELGSAPGIVRGEISPQQVGEWRASFPALRDRRSEYRTLR